MDDMVKQALTRPSDFAYFGDNDEMFVTWGFFGPSIHRDSDNIDKSNYEVVLEELEKRFPNDYEIIHSSHWAVGWASQIAIRVLDKNDEPTEVYEYMLDVFNSLQEYPILDEWDHSEKEHSDALDTIDWLSPAFEFKWNDKFYAVKENLPEDTTSQIFSYLFDTYSFSSSDDYSERDILEAYVALGYAVSI